MRDLSGAGTTLQLICASTTSATTGGTGNSQTPQLSDNATYVVYQSSATDLPGARTVGSASQIYRRTTATVNELASRKSGAGATVGSSTGCFNPSISASAKRPEMVAIGCRW